VVAVSFCFAALDLLFQYGARGTLLTTSQAKSRGVTQESLLNGPKIQLCSYDRVRHRDSEADQAYCVEESRPTHRLLRSLRGA